MTPTQNQAVLTWIDEMAARTRPASIVWIDGSEEQLEALRAQAVREGILTKLNQEKLPGCYLHRTDPLDAVSYTHLDVYKRQECPLTAWCRYAKTEFKKAATQS